MGHSNQERGDLTQMASLKNPKKTQSSNWNMSSLKITDAVMTGHNNQSNHSNINNNNNSNVKEELLKSHSERSDMNLSANSSLDPRGTGLASLLEGGASARDLTALGEGADKFLEKQEKDIKQRAEAFRAGTGLEEVENHQATMMAELIEGILLCHCIYIYIYIYICCI